MSGDIGDAGSGDAGAGDVGDAATGEPRRLSALDAALELQRQSWENAGELVETTTLAPERIQDAAHVDVGETPSEVVYSENKLDLLHYESQTDDQYDVPILLVYALINKPYILDLQPDRSVVRRLLEAGFDVYLIDWGEPSHLDSSLSLYDYVERYIGNCVDVVRERAGVDALNLFGYCMGGTMSAMYAALYPEKVQNLGLMATGLCFDDTGGVLEQWGGTEQYDPGELVETFGNAPGGLLSVGFAMLDPVQNFVTKYLRLYDNLEDEAFVENFMRMERWVRDSPDVAGETYREFIEYFYQDNRFMRNELYLGDRHVDVEALDMPILQLVAKYDHLVPPESSLPFNDVVASDDLTVIESPTGHIGLSVSSKAHEEVWPQVCEWFAERSRLDEEGAVEPEPAAAESESHEASVDEAVEAESGEPAKTDEPTDVTTGEPTDVTTEEPTDEPIEESTAEPIEETTDQPTEEPSGEPSEELLDEHIEEPTDEPIEEPTDEPARKPPSMRTREDVEVTVDEDTGMTFGESFHISTDEPPEEPGEEPIEEPTDETTEPESEPTEVKVISGIGQAYEERLREAGVETVEELAEADPIELAREVNLSEKRVRTWIDEALVRTRQP